MSGWDDPVVGGVALRRAAIQSPNYSAGVTGWTINQDGSAEFNNLTIRGVFAGTNFVINTNGAFFYSGTPAAGNLICSIATSSGIDAFGNHYLGGVATYDNAFSKFVQMQSGAILLGQISGGVPDTADAASWLNDIGGVEFHSGVTVSSPDALVWSLFAGATGQSTGSATTTFAKLVDAAGSSAADLNLSGSVVRTNLAGTPLTLQTPAYGSNWSDSTTFNGSANWGPLRWRADAENNLHIGGAFKAGGTLPGAAVCNIPAGFRPAAQYPLICARNNGGTLTSGFMLALTTGGNLDVITQTGGGIAINNEYLVAPTVVPLGTIP